MWLPVDIASLEGSEVERERSETLLEQLRREERATLGVDPDGTTYLYLSERIETVRAAYVKQLADEEHDAGPEKDAQPLLGTATTLS